MGAAVVVVVGTVCVVVLGPVGVVSLVVGVSRVVFVVDLGVIVG